MSVFNQQTLTRYQIMMDMCEDTTNKTILELGAGRYIISNWLREFKKRITMDITGRPDIVCDLNKGIKLPNNSVDIVIAGEVIEHLYNSESFVKELYRVIKRNGILVMSVPNCCSLVNRVKSLIGRMDGSFSIPELNEKYMNERHYTDFTIKHLKEFLEYGGFEVKQISTDGINLHCKRIFPLSCTPKTLGCSIIVKARKNGDKND